MTKASRLFGAIEAGGTKFVCAVGHSSSQILGREIFPTTTPDETFQRCRVFFEAQSDMRAPLSGIGVAAFGPLDVRQDSPNYGQVGRTPKKYWTGASYIRALAPLNAPLAVTTDVNGAALGEALLGAGVGKRRIVYVTVGTGIGAGVMDDGKIEIGTTHYEFGHFYPPHDLTIDPFEGCCPAHGDCLEGLACGPAIKKRWGKDLSELGEGHPGLALEAGYLAHLAVVITLCHAPDLIIFGGGVCKAPGLLDHVRRQTKELLNNHMDGPAARDMSGYIVQPKLGDFSAIAGAIALAQAA